MRNLNIHWSFSCDGRMRCPYRSKWRTPVVCGSYNGRFSLNGSSRTRLSTSPCHSDSRNCHHVCPAWHWEDFCCLKCCISGGRRFVGFQLACAEGQSSALCGWRDARLGDARASLCSGAWNGCAHPCNEEPRHIDSRHAAPAHAGFGDNCRSNGPGTVS